MEEEEKDILGTSSALKEYRTDIKEDLTTGGEDLD